MLTTAVDGDVQVQRTPWNEFVTDLNNSLDPLDLEFSRLHDEESGKEMWALVGPWHLLLLTMSH